MPIIRFDSTDLRLSRARHGCFALACLLSALTFVSCRDAVAQSDRVVARHQKAFYEAWLRRDLSDNELRQVTDELIAMYTKRGKDRAAIREIAQSFESYTKILREQNGRPAAITTRHFLLAANYFDPDMQNTTELRLLTEPDPVRVVDPGYKRLMTERDVVALVNIHHFAKSEDDPRHKELSRQDIDRLVAELDRTFGNYPKATEMPQFFGETAAFWAGVQQEWPQLSAEERRQARAYAGKTYKALMPTRMYARLWGLDMTTAFSRRQEDVMASMVYINEVNMRSSVLSVLMDKIASW
jgi:hypothetical protein